MTRSGPSAGGNGGWGPGPGRHISGSTTSVILSFVRRRGGRQALEDLVARAVPGRTAAELSDAKTWISYDEAVRLFETAASVTGEPDAGLLIGEEMLRQHTGTPTEAVLRSLGSPGELYRNIAAATSKFAAVSAMAAVEVTDGHARVSAVSLPGFRRHPMFCRYVAGQLSQAAVLYGLDPARVIEEECQTRGDPRCLYLVDWSGGERCEHESRSLYLKGRLDDLAAGMESLQSSAADLISAASIDDVLARIAVRAGDAVSAQGHLIAVSPVEGQPPVVHHDGLSDDKVAELEARLADPHPQGDASVLVAEVRSSRRAYGHLVAVATPGGNFVDGEERLLGSYAGLAAAALDSATALAESRKQADNMAKMLELARALADAAEPVEVCRRAGELIPDVMGCDRAAVMLFDRERARLSMVSLIGFGDSPPAHLARHSVAPSEAPHVADALANPRPTLRRLGDPDPLVARSLERFEVSAYGSVPIQSQGECVGLVIAGWSADPPAHLDDDAVRRLSGLADTISAALRNAELIEQIRHEALHDRLTGLANLTLLERHGDQVLRRARRRGTGVAVLFCDLDGFKAINDDLGHAAGDKMLRMVADRLRSCVRDSDLVGRLGGDEFVVVAEDVDEAGAEIIAGKVLEGLRQPLRLARTKVFARASIGVALFPEDGANFSELLGAADHAMYQAKRQGRNGYQRFSLWRRPASGGLRLEEELVAAIDSGTLDVHYQPEMDLATGDVVVREALVRWPHPTRGLLLPGEFLGIARDRGLLRDLDELVLRRACRDAAAWAESGQPVRVAVNLSEHHFANPEGLVASVTSALQEAGLPAHLLEVEIVESVELASDHDLPAALADLRRRGVGVCIDDFGTGYSVLDRLRALRVDKIKVAREFLSATGRDRSALVSTMAALCRALGAESVAEGIETEEQLALARSCGFTLGQGFLLGRPAPLTTPSLLPG